MYGYDLIDPATGHAGHSVTANVSDAFVATYEREARDVDPVLARAIATRRPAYTERSCRRTSGRRRASTSARIGCIASGTWSRYP
jgi:hypothetical protein